jgi:hypothetical protein
MTWFFSNGTRSRHETDSRNDDPGRPASGAWRDQKVDDPFEDPKVRQRIAEMIVRATARPDKFGG